MFSQCFCLSLSLTLPPCFSLNHMLSLYSSAVAQRQVVISACGVSFRYLCFRFSLFLLRHLSPLLTAAFFVFLFSLLLLLHHHCHHLSFSFFFLAVSPCFLWQLWPPPCSALPLTLLPLLMTSFLLLSPTSPNTPSLAPIPRLSLRSQDVRRCPVGPEVKPRLSTSHPTRHFDSSISSLCVVCVVLSVGRRA